jgi:TolA-binding protein
MSINSQTYVITLSLKDKNDNVLSTQSVDLPLETMIVSASYSNGVLTFTLKNGQTLQVPISDLIDGLVSTDTFNQAVQSLSNRITTIENDYLKASDKTELQNQITANADDIDDIQEEQLTQNADIESLQQENERLQRIVSGLPIKNASGTSFVLNDMVNCEIKEISLKGDTLQDGTPTPDAPVEIQSVKGNQEINVFGKNLYNLDLASGSIGSNGQNISDSKSLRTTGFSFIQNKEYSLSFESSSTISEVWLNYYNGDTFIRRVSLGSGNSKTFTTPTDANIVRFRFTSSSDLTTSSITKIQLEFGETPTSYEQYSGTTFPISLGNIELNKIGDYQDKIYKSNDKWYLEKNVEKYIINGNENYDNVNFSSTNTLRCLLATVLPISSFHDTISLYCNKLIPKLNWSLDEQGIYLDKKNIVFRLNKSLGINDIEDLIEWIKNNNITLYYVLDTPNITEITDDNLINQLEALNNYILLTNNTIISNGNLPVINDITGYVDIMSLLSTQNNRNVVEEKKVVTKSVEKPVEEPVEEPIEDDNK